MFVIKYKNFFIGLSLFFVVLALGAVVYFGLKPSIDFAGGVIVEVSYVEDRPEVQELEKDFSLLNLGSFSLRPSGENAFTLRTRTLSEAEREDVLSVFSENSTGEIVVERFNNIGPSIGEELSRKAYLALGMVVLLIVVFIAFSFRHVSRPVSSWKYGLVAVIALIHDIIIPTGVFAVLGFYLGYEIDTLFVTALLAIFGYSVSDTIVVFDRIRENLKKKEEYRGKESFGDTVGVSLSETMARSFNTSFTTFLALLALYIFGPVSTEHFALTLLVGVIAGTYSSIFLASPLLVLIERWQKKV
ncbi:MAG: hypothetical protein RJA61_484 [Candidatus Parcubacteria bacterium]|jgi:preprotein translocase subunit SecF